jgi:hypothetical protein
MLDGEHVTLARNVVASDHSSAATTNATGSLMTLEADCHLDRQVVNQGRQ